MWLIGYLPIKVKCLNMTSELISEEDDEISDDSKKKSKDEHIKIYLSDRLIHEVTLRILPFHLNFTPYQEQLNIINDIDIMYNKNTFNICRVLIWGKPWEVEKALLESYWQKV